MLNGYIYLIKVYLSTEFWFVIIFVQEAGDIGQRQGKNAQKTVVIFPMSTSMRIR